MKLLSSPTKPPDSLPLSIRPSIAPKSDSSQSADVTSARTRTPMPRNSVANSRQVSRSSASMINQRRPLAAAARTADANTSLMESSLIP